MRIVLLGLHNSDEVTKVNLLCSQGIGDGRVGEVCFFKNIALFCIAQWTL